MKFERANSKAKKLSPAQVREMREAYAKGATQSQLCRHFGVSVGQVGRIVRGESWQEVGTPAITPEQVQLSEERLRGRLQQELVAGPGVAAMAAEFKAMLAEPERRIPPSPLDGADTPAEVTGAVSSLEERAKAYNLDIEKLRKPV